MTPTVHACTGDCHETPGTECRKCDLIALDGFVLGCSRCVAAASITAGAHVDALTIAGATITASSPSRTLAGPLVRYGVVGRTSRGPLKVAPGALRFPDDLRTVKLTREHDRAASRGVLASVHDNGAEVRVSTRVSDGPEGDAALAEAADGTRDAFSFDVVDATIDGDTITDALVIAVGQVGIPAYADSRIDTIAAAATNPAAPNPEGTNMLTDQQRARLDELTAMTTRTTEQEQELAALSVLAGLPALASAEPPVPAAAPAAPAEVAASMPSVPAGVPAPTRSATTTEPAGGHMAQFVDAVVGALKSGGGTAAITAALADITHTAHSSVIEAPAWSGELWSGLLYESQFADLFTSGDLTNWEGAGWRFTSKLEIFDYAGDKAEIPTDNVTTESSSYEAARMAVGVDIDRKFFDFPNAAFLEALAAQVRESWAMKLDAKVKAYTLANAVPAEGVVTPADNLITAAGLAFRALKRRKVGKASWLYVNDDDMFTLLDYTSTTVPAFLDLFGIDPGMFRSSQDIPSGTVLAGVKQAATVRTLPGSPIRVDAQNITRAGIDEAFFGYWAIEEHHTSGIASVPFVPAP